MAALLIWSLTGSGVSGQSDPERRFPNRQVATGWERQPPGWPVAVDVRAPAALGTVTIRVVPTSTSIAEHRTFAVDVYLNAGDVPVDSVDCVMTYDTAYLEGISLTPGSALPQALGSNYIADGEIAYHHSVYAGAPAVSGTCQLFALEFAAIAPTLATTLHLDLAFVAGAGQGYAVRMRDGTIAIWAAPPSLYLPLITT